MHRLTGRLELFVKHKDGIKMCNKLSVVSFLHRPIEEIAIFL
jgi:hypothetical protein